MTLPSCFSASYAEARARFIAAAEGAGAVLATYRTATSGPDGIALFTDAAFFGSPDVERILVLISGTHGVEGLCGSACQLGWIESGGPSQLPAGVGVLLVHLINPFGVAWTQRETEEGFDLNRNYLDHGHDYPDAPLYAQVHDALMCPERSGTRRDTAEATIAEFRSRHGLQGYLRALFGGQYDWPDGMNYGGRRPAWSNSTLTEILVRFSGRARHVLVLDCHTGLGPHAHASLIMLCGPASPGFARAASWLGPAVTAVLTDDPGGATIPGHTGAGCIRALPGAAVTPVTVEFGTYDVERECRVVRDDLWLRHYGSRDSVTGRSIKSELREYFYPGDSRWRELVLCRSQQIICDGIRGLGSAP